MDWIALVLIGLDYKSEASLIKNHDQCQHCLIIVLSLANHSPKVHGKLAVSPCNLRIMKWTIYGDVNH